MGRLARVGPIRRGREYAKGTRLDAARAAGGDRDHRPARRLRRAALLRADRQVGSAGGALAERFAREGARPVPARYAPLPERRARPRGARSEADQRSELERPVLEENGAER